MQLGHKTAEFLAGRWQIPVALVAAAVACITLYRVRPAPVSVDVDALLADVRLLAEAGEITAAVDGVANLLDMKPPLPEAAQAHLHAVLADLVFQYENGREQRNADNVHLIIEHQERANEMGHAPDAGAALRLARAQDWLGHGDAAVFSYRQVLERNPTVDQRRTALQRLVVVLDGRPLYEEEWRTALYTLLENDGADAGLLWWALRRAVTEALDAGDAGLARTLVQQHGGVLKTSDLRGYYEYLLGLVMVHEHRFDEAEPIIDWIEEWLADGSRVAADRRVDSDLPALNKCLAGKLHLLEQQPERALQAFDAVLDMHTEDDLWITATIGRGRALDELERHEAALAAFGAVAAHLEQTPEAQYGGRAELIAALVESFDRRHQRREYDWAIDYLTSALRNIAAGDRDRRAQVGEQLAEVYAEAADNDTTESAASAYRRSAGSYFEQTVPLVEDGQRIQSLIWLSASQYDEGGWVRDARRMLTKYVNLVQDDPRLARALVRLGEGYELEGQYDEAIRWYRELIEAFPTLAEAAQAQVSIADCLIAQGEDRLDEAEAVLDELLSGEHFGPEATTYRDALLRQCQLLLRAGRYAEATSRLEVFQRLYPDDALSDRALFLAAETYRRSAESLRAQKSDTSTQAATEREARTRLETAAALYDRFLRNTDKQGLGNQRTEYERLALFSRGDCLLALGDTASLDTALDLYQAAAVRYETRPEALTAQVQLANVHLRLGQHVEAARAVEKARWLLKSIPDDTFAEHGEGTSRDHWDRYLTALAGSPLFRTALAEGN
ncbi:MAG: tetratricopeptide repeat protein [Phycisphaerae bacterium]|nr:tetratricopeptide repeat protein [Phycisphaerae bacterium]